MSTPGAPSSGDKASPSKHRLSVKELHISAATATAAVAARRMSSRKRSDEAFAGGGFSSSNSSVLRLSQASAPPPATDAPMEGFVPRRRAESVTRTMHRRGSMEKYIHRASTAAEEFHAAELEWLQNEALGYSPLLDEVTQAAREDDEIAPSYLMREGTNDGDEVIEVQQIDEDDILRHIRSTGSEGSSPGPSSPSTPGAASSSPRPVSPASLSPSGSTYSSGSDAGSPLSHSGTAGSLSHHDDELLMHAKNLTLQEGDHRRGRYDMHRITSIFAAKRRARYLTRSRDRKTETVAEYEGSPKELHEFKSRLTQDNALSYRKKNVVRAFKTDAPVSFVKNWGVSSGKKGDYVIWNKPGDLYAITAEEFEKNYIPRHHVHSEKSYDDHQYIKKTTVLARRIGYPFKLPHAKLGEISEGMRGDYVIQPENGDVEDQYIVFAETFLERYVIVGSFSEYTEMLKGVIMVAPSKELKRANSSAGAVMHLTAERTKVSSLAFQSDAVQRLLRGTDKLQELEERTKQLSAQGSSGQILGGSTLLPSAGALPPSESKTRADSSVSVAASPASDSLDVPSSPRQQDIIEPMGGSPERLGVMSWDFDIFALSHESRHWPLFHLAHHLFFERLDLVTPLGINGDLLSDFFAEIDDTYLPVAYHNSLHGADVLHGCYVMCSRTDLAQTITKGEHFSFLIAAMCHDLSHPGTNNMFQIDSSSRIALKYNDVSVLENFHIGTTFEILSKPVYSEMFPNPADGIGDVAGGRAEGGGTQDAVESLDANLFRKIVIQTILATDLAERERYYRDWDYRVLKKKNLELSTHHADRLLYMKMIIKCSDLKHPSLKRDAHLKWSAMVNEEFIQQAFKEDELGLPHRCPTTREPVAVAKSQAGFIRFLVLPTFRRFCEHVGGEFANFLVNRLKAQISFWNEARRRAEFRRGGRTVMVMNRLRKMSSRNVKVPSTVMEEEQSGAGGSDGVGGGASVSGHSRAYNKSASVPDTPSRESAPLLPPSERADGRENAPSPLRSETVMSDPGDPAVAGRKIDQRSMVDRTLSAPHSLTHIDASIGRE